MSKRSRSRNRWREQRPANRNPKPDPAPLNLDFANAATVVTPDWQDVQIILAGCGGIGAYMAQHVGRLMRVIYQNGKGVNLTLVDPDRVEEKNLGRQLFCEAEIGESKAVALARRYGSAWGLNTMAFEGEYSESVLMGDSDLIVLIGCVDNAKARGLLHETLTHNPEDPRLAPPREWWLDSGNLRDTGRVMLGSAYHAEQCRGAFVDKKKVISLPSPALQYPSLLIPGPDEVAGKEMSCAELQAANLQSLNINAAIAVQAADMLTRLLVTNDLKRYQCAVNLASGSVKSFFCTPEEIAREIGRPTSFVLHEESAAA